jgi:predicted dehydrogenase
MKPLRAALIGVNGYGAVHIAALGKLRAKGIVEIVALCDSRPGAVENSIQQNRAIFGNEPPESFTDFNALLAEQPGLKLDFVILAVPIHLHKTMSVAAMSAGCHVLTEKPPAVVVQDVDAMIAASCRYGKICGVNFQMTAGSAFRALQKAIRENQLGGIHSIKGVGMWQRPDSYYNRAAWAGKQTLDGYYVLDGVIGNPLSHLLNNMIFLARSAGKGITIEAVTAELYHAHAIEGDDTAGILIETSGKINLYFYATLCNRENEIPYIVVDGSNGKALWTYDNHLELSINGMKNHSNFPEEDLQEKVELSFCTALSALKAGTPIPPEDLFFCDIQSVRDTILVVNGAYRSSERVHPIVSEYTVRKEYEDSTATIIKGIRETIAEAGDAGILLSDTGIPWGKKGQRLPMAGFNTF